MGIYGYSVFLAIRVPVYHYEDNAILMSRKGSLSPFERST